MRRYRHESEHGVETEERKYKEAPIEILNGVMVIDGVKLARMEQITVNGHRVVSACLEAHLRLRKDGREYPVIAPLEITNCEGEEIALYVEHEFGGIIETPGWVFRSRLTGQLITPDMISDEIYAERGEEILHLCKAHEDWDAIGPELWSEFRKSLIAE